MKKIIPALLAVAVCLWAADFWQSKPYTEWSDKDVQRIETNSPWSKQVSVSLGDAPAPNTGRSKKGGGGGGGGGDMESGGGNLSPRAGTQDVGGGVIPNGGGAGLTLTVSWRTALPIREAVAKAKFGAEAGTSADAKKMIEEEQNFYAIMVTGLPARAIRANDKMKESLLKGTELIVKGKDPIQASDVQKGGNEQTTMLLFLFPKTTPLTVEDKDVEFSTRLGPIVIRQKFHLKDMVFNGKLDL